MNRVIDVLIMLAAVGFIAAIAITYEFIVRVFPAGAFWKFSLSCLGFAQVLLLLQLRDKISK